MYSFLSFFISSPFLPSLESSRTSSFYLPSFPLIRVPFERIRVFFLIFSPFFPRVLVISDYTFSRYQLNGLRIPVYREKESCGFQISTLSLDCTRFFHKNSKNKIKMLCSVTGVARGFDSILNFKLKLDETNSSKSRMSFYLGRI